MARILTELQVVYGHFEGLDMLVELATRVAETRDKRFKSELQQAFDSVF